MTPISQKMLYTIEAIIHIALYHGTRPINGKTLAETQNLPPRYLERMLQKLVHDGILRSIRGPRGGYVLAKERRHITLADIYQLVMEQEAEDSQQGQLTGIGEGIVLPVLEKAGEETLTRLSTTTIADLCEQAYHDRLVYPQEEYHARAEQARQEDFTI